MFDNFEEDFYPNKFQNIAFQKKQSFFDEKESDTESSEEVLYQSIIKKREACLAERRETYFGQKKYPKAKIVDYITLKKILSNREFVERPKIYIPDEEIEVKKIEFPANLPVFDFISERPEMYEKTKVRKKKFSTLSPTLNFINEKR